MDKKYALIIDTNIFDIQKELNNFSEPYLISKIEEIINKLKINNLIDYIKICIPKVVLMEFLKQQEERYEDETKKFSEKKYPRFLPKKIQNYMSWLNKKFISKLKEKDNYENRVLILDYPSNKNFKKIINRAILKQEPFEGKKGKSDKGFKDALIWYTLLEFKELNPSTKIILYSNDSTLTSDFCLEEYKQKFNDHLIIAKNVKEPYFNDVIKKEFNLDKFELDLHCKLKDDLTKKLDSYLFFNKLIGKTIYTKMGTELEIQNLSYPEFNIRPVINEEFPDFIIMVSQEVTAKAKLSNEIFSSELSSLINVSYDLELKKFKIDSYSPIHSDFTNEEFYDMIKFIEE